MLDHWSHQPPLLMGAGLDMWSGLMFRWLFVVCFCDRARVSRCKRDRRHRQLLSRGKRRPSHMHCNLCPLCKCTCWSCLKNNNEKVSYLKSAEMHFAIFSFYCSDAQVYCKVCPYIVTSLLGAAIAHRCESFNQREGSEAWPSVRL